MRAESFDRDRDRDRDLNNRDYRDYRDDRAYLRQSGSGLILIINYTIIRNHVQNCPDLKISGFFLTSNKKSQA